jgi:hypothetical protein
MLHLGLAFFMLSLPFGAGNNVSVTFNEISKKTLRERTLQTKAYYFTTISGGPKLGSFSPDAAVGNPLKGLLGSPFYTKPPHFGAVKASLEFYYIGLDSVMLGNPEKVGAAKAFNWTFIEDVLNGSASRFCHAVIRFFIHFPGQVLRIPQYLVDSGVEIVRFNKTRLSPYYGDPKLVEAMRQFITALGNKYDGDRRLACIQLGLLGYWGEWHTFGFPGKLRYSEF